ncbi:MAG: hypothetical protein DHS20C18_12930 [Saprospiraceae bacterium]|nr:MAG: hypothetical protein DHS20C18_12930 [Saprospiraceae bacterium]
MQLRIGLRLLPLLLPFVFQADNQLLVEVTIPLRVNEPPVNLTNTEAATVKYTSGWQILAFQPRDAYQYSINLTSGGNISKNYSFAGGNTFLYSAPWNFKENGFRLTNSSVVPSADSILVGQFGLSAKPYIRWNINAPEKIDTIDQYQSIGFQTPTSPHTLRFRTNSSRPSLMVIINGDSIPKGICLNGFNRNNPIYKPWLEAGSLDTTAQSYYQLHQTWQGQFLFIFNASPFPGGIVVDFF